MERTFDDELDVTLLPPSCSYGWHLYKQLSSPSVQDRSSILGKIATQLQGTVMFDHFASISNQYDVLDDVVKRGEQVWPEYVANLIATIDDAMLVAKLPETLMLRIVRLWVTDFQPMEK